MTDTFVFWAFVVTRLTPFAFSIRERTTQPRTGSPDVKVSGTELIDN